MWAKRGNLWMRMVYHKPENRMLKTVIIETAQIKRCPREDCSWQRSLNVSDIQLLFPWTSAAVGLLFSFHWFKWKLVSIKDRLRDIGCLGGRRQKHHLAVGWCWSRLTTGLWSTNLFLKLWSPDHLLEYEENWPRSRSLLSNVSFWKIQFAL